MPRPFAQVDVFTAEEAMQRFARWTDPSETMFARRPRRRTRTPACGSSRPPASCSTTRRPSWRSRRASTAWTSASSRRSHPARPRRSRPARSRTGTSDGGGPGDGQLNASLAQWLIASGRATAPYVARKGTALGRAGRVHVGQDADGAIWAGGGTVTRVRGEVEL